MMGILIIVSLGFLLQSSKASKDDSIRLVDGPSPRGSIFTLRRLKSEFGVVCDQGLGMNGQEPYCWKLGLVSGIVQVWHDDKWGAVCAEKEPWTDIAATVVCKQMGYGAGQAVHGYFTGSTNMSTWMSDVKCRGTEHKLGSCQHSPWTYTYLDTRGSCHPDSLAAVDCLHVPVRLAGDIKGTYGRLEVNFVGHWGTVCSYGWDDKDSEVVCRQMGFSSGKTLRKGLFRPGSPHQLIWLSNVECTGTEADLESCELSELNENYCTHEEDVGIQCFDECSGISDPCSNHCQCERTEKCDTTDTCLVCPPGWYGDTCQHRLVRLSGGYSEHTGLVEVRYGGGWSSVCSSTGWSQAESGVLCRQLGYTGWISSYSTLTSSNETVLPFVGKQLATVVCTGQEDHLGECQLRFIKEETPCQQNVWLNCQAGCPKGYFGDKCDELCDCPGRTLCNYTEGQCLTGQCEEGWKGDQCDDNEFVRLIGGPTKSSGRIEVFTNNEYSTIYHNAPQSRIRFPNVQFDVKGFVNIVCKQLGYTGGVPRYNAFYGEGNTSRLYSEIFCPQNPTQLRQCLFPLPESNELYHSYDIGADCYENCPVGYYGHNCENICDCHGNRSCNPFNGQCLKSPCLPGWSGEHCDESAIRLGEFSSEEMVGTVQLLYNDVWTYMVSDDSFYANVACRQLGYGGGDVYENNNLVNTTEAVYISCKGDELSVQLCAWGSPPLSLDSRYAAAVTCYQKCGANNYGKSCDKICHCQKKIVGVCDQQTGACKHGLCDAGYMGPYCQTECKPGYYGYRCQHQCHCKYDVPCNPVYGTCLEGCHYKYKGDKCQEEIEGCIPPYGVAYAVAAAAIFFVTVTLLCVYFCQNGTNARVLVWLMGPKQRGKVGGRFSPQRHSDATGGRDDVSLHSLEKILAERSGTLQRDSSTYENTTLTKEDYVDPVNVQPPGNFYSGLSSNLENPRNSDVG